MRYLLDTNILIEAVGNTSQAIAALKQADLVVFLARHKQFVGMETGKPVLDFCGVEQSRPTDHTCPK